LAVFLAKGYGFIQPAGGGQDVFVHISAVERRLDLFEAMPVRFIVEPGRNGKPMAKQVKLMARQVRPAP
jgi:cold shock protein